MLHPLEFSPSADTPPESLDLEELPSAVEHSNFRPLLALVQRIHELNVQIVREEHLAAQFTVPGEGGHADHER